MIFSFKGVVTEVKDQMNCGSCWAFGAVASIEAAHAQKYGELISMSEQQLVDCVEGTSCATGGLPSKAWEYVNKAGGINSEENYPYEGCKTECRFDEHHIVASVLNFTRGERDGDEENLIRRLNDHPQTVAIDAGSFSFQHYKEGIMQTTYEVECNNDFNSMNHAVFVVGYDTVDGNDFYIVKNSWAKTWGEDGYFRIARGINACGIANYPGHAEA